MKLSLSTIICLLFAATSFATVEVDVCDGMTFSISASDVDLTTFQRCPKVYVEYNGAEKSVKVADKSSDFPKTSITCVWLNGFPVGDYPLYVERKGEDPVKAGTVTVNAPELHNFTPNQIATGDTLTVYGRYFGVGAPKFTLQNASGDTVSRQVVKPLQYADWRGKPGKSCMDVDTGDSQATLLIKGELTKGETVTVGIANRVGETSESCNRQTKTWTFLFYTDGDNNLDQDMITMFENIAETFDGDNINAVMQLDRAKGDDNHGEYGGWTITHRFEIANGMEPTEANAIADWHDGEGGGREVDMTLSSSLTAFLAWGMCRYPADQYVLVISDHGFGWRGCCVDDTSGDSNLEPKDIKEALNKAPETVDLLLFDDCHMQTIEVLRELRDTGVQYVVGSEAPLSPPFPHNLVLDDVAANPTMTLAALATDMVDRYAEVNEKGMYYTLSAAALAGVDDFLTAYGAFTDSAIAGDDLTTLQAKAAGVLAVFDDVVIHSKAGGDTAYCRGLTIYFPDFIHVTPMAISPPDYDYFYTQKRLDFLLDVNWREFMEIYFHRGGEKFLSGTIIEARQGLDLYGSGHIDLYTFCDRIVKSAE